MSYVIVRGGAPLEGELKIQGSKNAVLPILAAVLLSEEKIEIANCPKIQDVESMLILLGHLGVSYHWREHTLCLHASHIRTVEIKKEDTERTRASILVLGAMLGRMKEAEISYPGGCAIGQRPINYHLDGFRKLHTIVKEEECRLICKGDKMRGEFVLLPFPSVGATENIMLAAVLVQGETCIVNAAVEPEIIELGKFLSQMGAKITGVGTRHIRIEGVKKLRGGTYYLKSDRIAAGTYLAAATAAKGNISLKADCTQELSAVFEILEEMGADLSYSGIGSKEETIHLKMKRRPKCLERLCTGVYPAFPTDLQSQFMTILSVADGNSIVEENIFENRFRTAEELKKMGANIVIKGKRAYIYGRKQLKGTVLKAPDLRGGAALVIAGLVAEGTTKIEHIEYINRGYENYYDNLKRLGAYVEEVKS